jgi:MtN3 and saliva related transmembrane protein
MTASRASPLWNTERCHWTQATEMNMATPTKLALTVLGLSMLVLSGCDLGIQDTASLFAPRFQRSEIFGFIAGAGTTFAALPDLIGMLRRRSSKGMNPTMAGIMCVFQIGWIYYGLLIASRPVIVWNMIAVVINSLSVAAYFRFARLEPK